MSKNSNMKPPRRRDLLSLAAAGAATALPVPLSARDRVPDFGPCSGFIASAPGRRRAWTRGEAPAGRPFREDSPFRVASVSKMVAATVIAPIAQSLPGGLDADVSDRLGFRLRHPAWPDQPIPLRSLLSHTSGLRNGPDYPVPAGRTLASALGPDAPPAVRAGWFGPADQPPGARFSYADVNFAVLAQWAERVTGQRFDRLMHDRLLAPAGTDAGYNWSGVSEAARRRAAPGLRLQGGTWAAQVDANPPPAPDAVVLASPETPNLKAEDVRPGENGFAFSPQGGLRLSLSDMDRLARTFLADRDRLLEMEVPAWRMGPEGADNEGGVMLAYGLGVQVLTGRPGVAGDAFFGPDSADWRGHLGDAYGWMTGLFWNRRTGESLCWALNGMPETDRPSGRRTALTAPEEDLIAAGLRALGRKTGPG